MQLKFAVEVRYYLQCVRQQGNHCREIVLCDEQQDEFAFTGKLVDSPFLSQCCMMRALQVQRHTLLASECRSLSSAWSASRQVPSVVPATCQTAKMTHDRKRVTDALDTCNSI